VFTFQAQAHKLNANNTGLHVGNETRLTRIQLNDARKTKTEEEATGYSLLLCLTTLCQVLMYKGCI
jgi:hypothetical protein